MIAVIILMLAALAVNGQTPITTANCPTGEYVNYKSTAYAYGYSPVRQLTSGSYSYCGFYGTTASTAAASADQCCKACATQSGGACTTWTYDGCGRCYLSSATGTGVYLYYSSPASVSTMCGSTQTCSSFVSGFISSAASSNGQVTTTSPGATTTAAATTTTSGAFTTTTAGGAFTTTTVAAAAYSCFFNNNVNVATPPNSPNADTQVTASSSQDCCNKCGNTNGCLGFAFLSTSSTSGACWLKYYNPFGSNTPSQQTAYPGMVLGSLQGLAGK